MATTSPRAARRSYFATVPPQEILPIVDASYESSVSGIFVIGDVTGLPLVKIAANQGADVIERMQQAGRFRPADAEDGRLDLVIIGAGPAGLAAAVEAEHRGLRYVVLERSVVASTVQSFPPGKKVYAEPRGIANHSRLDVEGDLERDVFLSRIAAVVHDNRLKIKTAIEVTRVRKTGERQFEVDTKEGTSFPARQVVVAVGRQGQPRLLDCPGADRAEKVTYRLHTADDYQQKDVLVVGGGNSAIEAALMLSGHNRVTLSYRGDDFFRAKDENRRRLEQAEREGRLTILRGSHVEAIEPLEVRLNVAGETTTIPNDQVIILIGTLPPVDFLLNMGLELDGIWTAKRVGLSIAGLAVGIFIYFFSKHFVLTPAAAGAGKWLLPGMAGLAGSRLITALNFTTGLLLPVGWLLLLAATLMDRNRRTHGKVRRFPVARPGALLTCGAVLYAASRIVPSVFTVNPAEAGHGPYYVPGLAWIYHVVPTYFANAYGLYYLLYFAAIAVFGLYWAWRSGHRKVWRRNLTIIATQWTLWWGVPTFLAVFLGRNPWTPLIARSLNAWPLNIAAFRIDPVVGPGDPAWWHTVALVGVVWAAVLTFIIIPTMTIGWGKVYCSYFCSCGALAETVGNGFRHRGPKGDKPRRFERFGFVIIPLAAIATIADLLGYPGPLGLYNMWVGTLLAGALAIGLYPFLGQRVWCRMWCPLAFWMNFWGRWSDFRITSEKGKCIDCNVCNQYCQMGIDIKSRALKGIPITLKDTPCVACSECVVRCPMQILHLGKQPPAAQVLHTVTVPAETSPASVRIDRGTPGMVARTHRTEASHSPETVEPRLP